MTKIQRLKEIFTGLLMLLGALIILKEPSDGYLFIIFVLSVILTVMGIRKLFHYFAMARFMVDGKTSLYKGVMMLDFGILTGTLTDVPRFYVLIYLICIHAFAGIIDILRAREAKAYGIGLWKYKTVQGVIQLLIAAVCIINVNNPRIAVFFFGTGLIYSALLRIVYAFRRTGFVYIQ